MHTDLSRRSFLAMTATTGLSVSLPGCGGGPSKPPDQMVRYSAFRSKVRGLDPIGIGDTTSAAVGANIFDTILQYHYLRTQQLIPSLAAEMPSFSADRTTVTIKLRDDVRFHDDPCFPKGKGRKLVAGDFVYSWKRLADANNAAPNWAFLAGRIVGLDAFNKYTAETEDPDYDRTVEGLTAVDDHTLRIKLTHPWPQIRYVMAHLPTAPVPREAVEKYGQEFLNNPVGTGAFVLSSWSRGSKIFLERNPNYREETYPSEGADWAKEKGLLTDAGKKLPFLDRVEISNIQEDQPYWLTFKDGELDAASIPKDSFNQAIAGGASNPSLTEQMKRKGIELLTQDDPSTFWVSCNMKDPVVGANLPLRQALSLAINREDYIQFSANGRGKAARGVFPPVLEVYNDQLESPFTQHDPDKARQLVEKAKEVHGGELPQLTLSIGGTDASSKQRAQYLTRAWQDVGLNARFEQMDWPTLQQKVDNQSAQLWTYGWLADYPDGENYLFLFYGPNEAPEPNSCNYKSDRFDTLFEKARRMPPGPERKQLYRKLEQMVVDDLPVVPLLHSIGFALKYPWLHNYQLHPWASGTFKYQRVDVQQRWKQRG